MIFSLSAPGDVGTLTLDRLEQVNAFTGHSPIYSGIVPGSRELTEEFRYRNPTTWSAWATLTNTALAALVIDSDQAVYLQTRYTRTGADTTGSIDILRHDFLYTPDPTAQIGPGVFTNTTLYADIVDFVTAYIGSNLVQVNSGDGLTVKYTTPAACAIDRRPQVYFHDLQMEERTTDAMGKNYRQRLTVKIGIKGQCGRDETKIRAQFSKLIEAFNPYTWDRIAATFTFKGEERIAISPAALGAVDPFASNMVEIIDDDCDCIFNEFMATFFVVFPIDNSQLN